MFVAIDDTYGPAHELASEYVTGRRRTHVAVLFPDDQVAHIRSQLRECLGEVNESLSLHATEFHFVDIYNRTGQWAALKLKSEPVNLGLFGFFAEIYSRYRWRVRVQTVDDRTEKDHPSLPELGAVDELDSKRREDQSLLLLLWKVKEEIAAVAGGCTLFIDEGRRGPGHPFAPTVMSNWFKGASGQYCSSSAEPLLQIADFIAFCVNRSTHLMYKKQRSEIDLWFLSTLGAMRLNSPDMLLTGLFAETKKLPLGDAIHRADRARKGLEPTDKQRSS